MFSLRSILLLLCSILGVAVFSQEISLYQQFNGHYDYTAFGNTLNTAENGQGAPCEILTSSSADFDLEATGPLPADVSVAFYWDEILLGLFYTQNSIPIGGSETGEVELYLPDELPNSFPLTAVVDDDWQWQRIGGEI